MGDEEEVAAAEKSEKKEKKEKKKKSEADDGSPEKEKYADCIIFPVRDFILSQYSCSFALDCIRVPVFVCYEFISLFTTNFCC